MSNPIGKVIAHEAAAAYTKAIKGLSHIIDTGSTKEMNAAIKQIVKDFSAHGVTKGLVKRDAVDFGTREIHLPPVQDAANAIPASTRMKKADFKPTPTYSRGRKSEGAKEADYRKSLTMFHKMSQDPNTDPDAIVDEISIMSRKYGKSPEQLQADLHAILKRGDKVGSSVFTPAKKANELRAGAVDAGVPKATADRLIYEEGKNERLALNQGTEEGDPAKTRSFRVGIKLTPEERKAMEKTKVWQLNAADERIEGTAKEVGAPETYWVFAKSPEEATHEISKVMGEVHAAMASDKPKAKSSLEIPKKSKAPKEEPKTESTTVDETPKKPAEEPETPAEEMALNEEPDTTKQQITPEEVRKKLEENGKDAGFLGGKNSTDVPPEDIVVPSSKRTPEVPVDDSPYPNRFVPQYKKGPGKKIAAGVLGAGGLAAGMMMTKGDKAPQETQKEVSQRRLGDIKSGSVSEAPAQTSDSSSLENSDVVDTVKTQGGDYNVYRKDSSMAQSFRDAFAKAKKDGLKVFEWNGLKYKV